MHITTHTCSECGTIVAANELEDNRVMKCPGLACDTILRFDDLPESERVYFLENKERYEI